MDGSDMKTPGFCDGIAFRNAEICGKPTLAGLPGCATGAITIPHKVFGCPIARIGDYAFFRCIGLEEVQIPDSVTSIGASAFYGCSGLKKITIPSGVTGIGDRAFWGCRRLETITISDSV
ncbi:MAG: leucine-rich repeat domain-containing protein, partial [Kiritimatiellae bacterium]|nr:leucine-rich repeat domain-containing protein [Kiritimatiellia bacterium]